MKKYLTRIAPLRAGIVIGILYGLMALIFLPFIVFAELFGASTGGTGGAFMLFGGIAFAIFIPVIYAIMGFIGGIIGAALYNLVANWTGGIEFEVRDETPPATNTAPQSAL